MTAAESRRDPRKKLVAAWVDQELKEFVRKTAEARNLSETDLIIELIENYRTVVEQRRSEKS